MVAANKMVYVKNAPPVLVAMYEARHAFPGRSVLGRLLTDERMNRPWRELYRKIKLDSEWERLWKEIAFLVMQHRKPYKSKADRTKRLKEISKLTHKLQKLVVDTDLDLPLFYLMSDDVMAANGIHDWLSYDEHARTDIAYHLLPEWPLTSDVLDGLAFRSEVAAAVSKRTPMYSRTLIGPAREFAASLVMYLLRSHGARLNGTVAKIAQVALEVPIDKKTVERIRLS